MQNVKEILMEIMEINGQPVSPTYHYYIQDGHKRLPTAY